MYTPISSKQFEKSYRKISQRKNFDKALVQPVVQQLAAGVILESRYRDHELKGRFEGIHECHIKDDILLLYRKDKDILILLLVDTGTHSSLFE